MSAGGAAAAAAAAAEMARRRRQEEEEMTPYTPQDLNEGWEFKILRSATKVFKRPEFLRQTLEEEAKAGWQLVEKFDDDRIRLKRPPSARANDASLDFDPYRTYVGMTQAKLGLIIFSAVFGGFVLLFLCIILIVKR
jgi:hypothetical protein